MQLLSQDYSPYTKTSNEYRELYKRDDINEKLRDTEIY